MKKLHFLYIFSLIFFAHVVRAADSKSILGNWVTIDKKTGNPGSIVQISRQNDMFFGKIVKIYAHQEGKSKEVCTKCSDDRYNKPILGLTIVRNVREKKEGQYVDGAILSPSTGKEYHCTLELTDDGSQLILHVYAGSSMFSKTEVWTRFVQ